MAFIARNEHSISKPRISGDALSSLTDFNPTNGDFMLIEVLLSLLDAVENMIVHFAAGPLVAKPEPKLLEYFSLLLLFGIFGNHEDLLDVEGGAGADHHSDVVRLLDVVHQHVEFWFAFVFV